MFRHRGAILRSFFVDTVCAAYGTSWYVQLVQRLISPSNLGKFSLIPEVLQHGFTAVIESRVKKQVVFLSPKR